MGFFQNKSKHTSKPDSEDTDLLVEDDADEESVEFKMMDRQEIFAPDLTSPVISALISENIEAGRNGKTTYGITDVMKLITTISDVSDSELALVIKTIASFGIDIKAVVKEAIEKERLAKHRITSLKQDIEQHQQQIEVCKEQVDLLEVGMSEMAKSKDYLIKGMRLLTDADKLLDEKNSKTSSTKKVKSKKENSKAKTSKKKTTGRKKAKIDKAAETVELTSINLDVKPVKPSKSKTRSKKKTPKTK